ncbi:glycosyltransferase family A protein [Mucilaginibacter sp.]|uniref:glycosyltransferase family 2 protein n=1 Tax=Mucilaginibacter sp. TaxID=1882438 RepID=UPI002611A45A|nr:glycosyltransferase family A protein [Mucilaginibacter sp.]MDB4927013.1 glycosyltransferase family 2 protein [Mucilaginibacter sp.]
MEKGIAFPLVSVIIPAYNVEKYISNTIQSVIKQTYSNIEVIIVNDGSTDNTKQIIENDYKSNAFVKLIDQPNLGASAARNAGYKIANGEFIKFLDGDDLINAKMIAHQVSLTKSDSCIISSKWGRFYNNDIATFKFSPEECWQTMSSVQWICSSWKNAQSMTNPGIFLIPRQLIGKVGLWDEKLCLFDDTEYFTRTILAANEVIFSDSSTLYYRSGNQSLSSQLSNAHAQSAYYAVLKSTQYLISTKDNMRTRLLSANCLQQLIYYFYPEYPELCSLLKKEIKDLGGSNIEWASSKKGKFLSKFIGWKLAKKITKWLR